jgi:7-cyano-7-deazaguanine synthase
MRNEPASQPGGDLVRKALVLFSGGLDSTTLLHVARSQGFEPELLIFRYGQRHGVEVERAIAIARRLGLSYQVQEIDLRALGGSALTSDAIDVPSGRSEEAIA